MPPRWNFAARVDADGRASYLRQNWSKLMKDLRQAGCPADARSDPGLWDKRGCSFVASRFALRKLQVSETQASYFKLVHYVYAVELFQRLWGADHVFVLRFERCLGETTCGPALASFLGMEPRWIHADPYAEFKNEGAGHKNVEEHKKEARHVLNDPNATMALLGFEPQMAEDLLWHERLLHDLLGWDWDWDASNPVADAALPSPAEDASLSAAEDAPLSAAEDAPLSAAEDALLSARVALLTAENAALRADVARLRARLPSQPSNSPAYRES